MKIQKIKVSNFRKHENSSIVFENDLTALVGENDTGKSSLIDALKIIISDEKILITDFLEKDKEINIELHTNGDIYILKSSIIDDAVSTKRFMAFESSTMVKLKDEVSDLEDEEVRVWSKKLGIRVASNSRIDTLKTSLLEKLNEKSNYHNKLFSIESNLIPNIKTYFLSGVQFESLDKFIQETFFRARQREIWNTIVGDVSLSDFIQDRLIEYKKEAESEIQDAGIIDLMRQYIPDLESIEINPIFDKKDVTINLSVQVVTQSGESQSVSRFGDGTRRRLTIALLEHRAKMEVEGALYLLDEPDTHLHVKAQNELLDALDLICKSGSQIIATTHSPFIMNSVGTRQIRIK